MKRFNYNLNYQTAQTGKFFQLVPLNYIEVVPGDTVQGTIQTRLLSDTTKVPILNRTYFDTYAFYIPFRLMWDEFPEFIANRESGLSVPRITNTWRWNFEPALLNPATEAYNPIWLRSAYNLVYNQFFRRNNYPERSETDNTPAVTFMRPSTWHESLENETSVTETDISGDSTVSDLRQSFAKDRFDKVRQFYGSKYTDYLAALGVQASWSILDEPETIGKKHADLPYRMINATADTSGNTGTAEYVGDPAGYFDGVNSLSLKRTFCPEHGIIAVYAVPRMDTLNDSVGGLPLMTKINTEDYFSPEYLTERKVDIRNRLLGEGNGSGSSIYRSPIYEDLRKGINYIAGHDLETAQSLYFATFNGTNATNISYNTRNPNTIDDLFVGRLGGDVTKANYQLTSRYRIKRSSPIRPDSSSHGVA